MKLKRITAEDIAEKGVVNAPDKLVGNPHDNKMLFDRLIREVVAGAINAVIDQMEEMDDREDIRDEAEANREAAEQARQEAEALRQNTFQEEIAEARGHKEDAEKAKDRSEENARRSEAYAVGQEDGTDIDSTNPAYRNNAKFYAEQARAIVGGDDVFVCPNVLVSTGAWQASTKYEDFPWEAKTTVKDVTQNHVPFVVFDYVDSATYGLATVADTADEALTVYSVKKPERDILIPAAVFMSEGAIQSAWLALKGGEEGEVLAKKSGEDHDFTWMPISGLGAGLDGERGLAIYRAKKNWGDWAYDTYAFADLHMPPDYVPKVNDIVLTADNYLCYVIEVNEGEKTVVVTSFSPTTNLNGAPGPAGADGKDGKNGEPGPAGADGKDGADGAPGKDGADGKNGQDGAPGPRGLAIYRAKKAWSEWTSEYFDFSDFILPTGYVPQVNDLVLTSNNYLCYVYEVNAATDTFIVASFMPAVSINGADGGPGTPGFSPLVTVTDIDGGHRVTIEDENGSKTFDVMDGGTGPAGPAGADGNTPYIGANGNWWINGEDTGVAASGDGSGGASVQSDLEENDETKPSYVKGRTHWKEYVPGTVVINTRSVNLKSEKELAVGGFDQPSAGEMHIVTWGDRSYETPAKEVGGKMVLGNASLVDSVMEDTGEPFAIERFSASAIYVYSLPPYSSSNFVKIKATKADVEYHKLPKEYLPDDIDGSVSVQADLAENDPEAPGYVKNRTHWVESGMVELLPKTTVEFDPDSGEGYLMDTVAMEVGGEYIVTWNGVEYTCTAQSFDMDGAVCTALGDLGAITGGTSTGEPFIIGMFPPELAAEVGVGGSAVAIDGSTSATVSIAFNSEVVHTIPDKFLPRYLPRIENLHKVILPETVIGEVDSEGAGPFALNNSFVMEENVCYDVTLNGETSRYIVTRNTSISGLLVLNNILVDDNRTLQPGNLNFEVLLDGVYIMYVHGVSSGDTVSIVGPIFYRRLGTMLAPETTAPLVLIWAEDEESGEYTLNATEQEVLDAVRNYRSLQLWYEPSGDVMCYTFSYEESGSFVFSFAATRKIRIARLSFSAAGVPSVVFSEYNLDDRTV